MYSDNGLLIPSHHEALTQCWVNVGPRNRRRATINPTLGQRLVFAYCSVATRYPIIFENIPKR